MTPNAPATERKYQTLEEIRLRKEQLYEAIQNDGLEISKTWKQLFVSREDASRTEYITKMFSYGVTAFDAYMTVRKLRRNYGSLLSLIGMGKKKHKLKK